jgi:hypothetical protein
MIQMVHKIASWYLKRRMEQVEHFMQHPDEVQQQWFDRLIADAHATKWGKRHGYTAGMSINDFRARTPISTYEDLYPWINRAFQGESDVLWPGKMHWFAKSSGTTNDRSKFIPVTEGSLEECHFKAGQDMLAMYLEQRPASKLFTGKALSIGGSHSPHPTLRSIRYGDVSAVMMENLPVFYELLRTPSKEVALMANWEEKIDAMANEVMYEDVTSIAGVPTWTMVLINHIFDKLELTSRNLREVWPNLELYLHGGVSFEPYRRQFEQMIPGGGMTYVDVYNASEGYFAMQNDLTQRDLLLMLDYGIFYEFIPLEHLGEDHPPTHTVAEVELERQYAMVISTNSGLWRYLIGDTVVFTQRAPYKIRVSGRTKHFINAFGEELMIENAELAITEASAATGALVTNFTAAPIYFEGEGKGGHEWLVEFERSPDSLDHFREVLDQVLRHVNSDYDAKRQGNLALLSPRLHPLPTGTFFQWMKKRGKLGGQHKVPRLANHREYVEDILALMAVR